MEIICLFCHTRTHTHINRQTEGPSGKEEGSSDGSSQGSRIVECRRNFTSGSFMVEDSRLRTQGRQAPEGAGGRDLLPEIFLGRAFDSTDNLFRQGGSATGTD